MSCDKPQLIQSKEMVLVDINNADFGKYPSNYKSIALTQYKYISPFKDDSKNIKISIPKKEYAVVEDPTSILSYEGDTPPPIGAVIYGYSICLEDLNVKAWFLIRNGGIVMVQNTEPLPFISSGHPCDCTNGPSLR